MISLIDQSTTRTHQYSAFSLILVDRNFSKVAQAMQDPVLNPVHHLLSLHGHMCDTCSCAYEVHLTAQLRTCLLHTWSV